MLMPGQQKTELYPYIYIYGCILLSVASIKPKMCGVKELPFICFFLASSLHYVFASAVFTCHMGNQTVDQRPQLPVSRHNYGECVNVSVWMTAEDFQKKSTLEISTTSGQHTSTTKYNISSRSGTTWNIKVKRRAPKRQWNLPCHEGGGNKWNLVYNCEPVKFGNRINVAFTTGSGRQEQGSYVSVHPKPEFHLSVDRRYRSVSVTIQPGDSGLNDYTLYGNPNTRLCYQRWGICDSVSSSSDIRIDPQKSLSAIFNFTYILPCVCVEAYFSSIKDARRRTACPFKNDAVLDVRDVWRSSTVKPYESVVKWISECPPTSDSYLPSAALCWKHHETQLCTPILNSSLHVIQQKYRNPQYNISAVDKHPQMCLQFSLQGSYDTRCIFQHDTPKWDAHIGAGSRRVIVYLTSSLAANYSAQLCVLSEMGCNPRGHVYSVKMEGGAAEALFNVPFEGLVLEKMCVQVWQSDPAMQGRRILCIDTTHGRCGMFGVAALAFAVTLALMGIIVRHVMRKGVAGWLTTHRPVLLVSSSDQTSHVSAVCVLASILQGEVCSTVRMAQWAHCSDRGASSAGAAAVADLGPLPWLYGQWEAVHRSEGKVLIVWSADAKEYYERWRGESRKGGKEKACEGETMVKALQEDWKLKGKRIGKGRKQKSDGHQGSGKLPDANGMEIPLSEPSSVTEPVFKAAMASLHGALQEQGKDHGVAFVYFQGIGHSRDIPKDLRHVPRYCLPQDFRGLIQELGGTVRVPQSGKLGMHCWPQLLSKILSLWLARRLTHRLRKSLRQTQRTKVQRQRLESPLSADMTTPEAEQEQEPLHV